MFEMLGNWSFGDYFKKEAIDWAWELLTKVYKLDKSRLYVTVFAGDKLDATKEDTEAISFWSKHVKKDEIIKCSKKDNFGKWEMLGHVAHVRKSTWIFAQTLKDQK